MNNVFNFTNNTQNKTIYLSMFMLSVSELTGMSAMLRISFTDCRVVTDAMSVWVRSDRSEIGLDKRFIV